MATLEARIRALASSIGAIVKSKASLGGAAFTGQITGPSALIYNVTATAGGSFEINHAANSGLDGTSLRFDHVNSLYRMFENGGNGRGFYLDFTVGFAGSNARIWHEGNFNPSAYVPAVGGPYLGQVTFKGTQLGNAAKTTIAQRAGDGSGLQVISAGTLDAAAMTFHIPGQFATWFGLDLDNQFKIGGWSWGLQSFVVTHSGNIGDMNVPVKDSPTSILLKEAMKFQGIQMNSMVFIEQFAGTDHPQVGKSLGRDSHGFNESPATRLAMAEAARTGKTLWLTPGRHRQAEFIRTTAPFTMKLMSEPSAFNFGQGQNLANMTGNTPSGAWMYLDQGGPGFEFAADGVAHSYDIEMATIRNQPAPVAGWQPYDHNYDVIFSYCRHTAKILCLNATRGVLSRAGGYGKPTISMAGQFFKQGFRAEQQFDAVNLPFFYGWELWSQHPHVMQYMLNNLDALQMNGVDGLFAGDIFSIHNRCTLRYGADPFDANHGNALHNIDSMYCDGTGATSIIVDAECPYLTLSIKKIDLVHITGGLGGTFGNWEIPVVVNGQTGGWGIDVAGRNSSILIGQLLSAAQPEGIIRLRGQNGRCQVQSVLGLLPGYQALAWNWNGNGNKAFMAGEGSNNKIYVRGPVPHDTSKNTSDQLFGPNCFHDGFGDLGGGIF